MATNLLDVARAQLTPEVVLRASSLVDESPASTRRAMETAAPAIFAGLVQEGSSVPGARHLLTVLEEAGLAGVMARIAERAEAESGPLDSLVDLGKGLLDRLFGERVEPIVDAAARSSGVKRSSMTSLLGLTTPLVLGALGSEVAARQLDAAGLARFLAEQTGNLAGVLPAGVAAALRPASPPGHEAPDRAAPRASSPPVRIPWRLLVILPLAILAGLLLRPRSTPQSTHPEANRPVELAPTVVGAPPAANPPSEDQAPPAGEGTVGQQLAAFLAATGGHLPRRFVLENVTFAPATAQLEPASTATLDSVAAALKDHPSAAIVLTGPTDDVGSPAEVRRLSQRRADAIKAALVERGVAAQSISAAGIDQEPLVPSNDSEEGKPQSRRAEIVVVRR